MFNFNDLNLKKLKVETRRDAPMYADRSSLADDDDDMQIDSSSSPFKCQ